MDTRARLPVTQSAGQQHFVRFLPDSGNAFDVPHLMRIIGRHKLVILLVTLVLIAVAVAVIYSFTRLYTASATVMIGSRATSVMVVSGPEDQKLNPGITGLPDAETIESEGEVLRSRALASRVVDKLGLMDDPEFNPMIAAPTGLGTVLASSSGWLDQVGAWLGFDPGAEVPPAPSDEKEATIAKLADQIEVSQVGRSRVLQIDCTSQSAEKAAGICNTLVELYVASELEMRAQARQRASAWLTDRIAELRTRVAEAEQAVEDYRRGAGIVQTKDVELATQQVSDLSTQLVLAESQRAEAEARLHQVEEDLKSRKSMSSSEVLSSALIQKLREQEAEARSGMAELEQTYGPLHPEMVAAKARFGDIEQKIAVEVGRIVEGIRGEVTVARVREQALRERVAQLEETVADKNNATVTLAALERDALASRTLLEELLQRAEELGIESSLQEGDARVVSAASVPTEASFPRRGLLLLFAVVGGGGIGIVAAFIMEALDSSFKSLEQVEKLTGLSGLALIPSLTRIQRIASPVADYVLKRPASAYSEAFRSLQASLLSAGLDDRPRRVLVTSSLPREGKTATVIGLARVLAAGGDSVIVLDCDLRRPRLHRLFAVPVQPGMSDLLEGRAAIEDVVRQDGQSSVRMIAAGSPPRSPTQLLRSEAMLDLLQKLAAEHDWVLIDSAPVMAVSDARVLARGVDGVAFVTRWGGTRRTTAMAALRQLADAEARIAGIALTMVDVRRNSKYEYGDSVYYSGRLRRYYSH